MLAFLEILKVTALATLAALLAAPWLSNLHTVMLGVLLFYLNIVRISGPPRLPKRKDGEGE